jgi:autotransporter-associated beta strand protein
MAFWQIGQPLQAATFTWDTTPGTVGAGNGTIEGGTGVWNLVNGNWTTDAGVNNVAWGNTSADDAIFGGTGGTVTINTGTGITANKLTFNVDGYTVNSNVAADLLTLAGTTPTITVTTAGHTAIIDAIIAGSAGLTKGGAGTLTLNAANTYTGITTISAGTVRLGNAAALGSSAAATDHTTVAAGATLDLNGLSIAESFGRGGATLPLDGFGGVTAILTNSSATAAAITGTINFDGAGAFTVNGTGNISLDRVARTNGTTGNPVITKDGANTLILAGTVDNSALGLTVNAGVVQLNKGGSGVRALGGPSTIGATGTLRLTTGQANMDQLFSQVDLTNNGTFDLQGQDESFNNMTGTGLVTNGATNDASVLTLGENNGGFTWGGVIQNGAGTSTLALTKVGTGTMTITNNNTYTGATQISGTGGGLTLNFSAVGGGNDNLISASSALTMNNTSASRNQTLTLTGDTVANIQTFNGTSITGVGTRHLIIATSGAGGSMTLNLGALSITSGALVDFVLPTTGAINTTSANTILGPLVTVNNGGAYARILGGQIAAFTGDLTYVTATNIGALGGYTATGNLLVDSTSTGNVIQAAGTTDLSTVSITDAAARTLTIGTGNTLRLGAAGGILRSSAAGSAVVGDSGNAGTLTTGALAGADLVLTNGNATGTLTVNSTIANNAGGAVDVIANGAAAATTVLAGANTYTGTTTVQAGVLRAANGAAFGTIAGGVTLLDGAAVELSGGITIGDEALSILGTGVSTNGALRNQSGTNTYGGLVTLAGTGEIQADTGTTLIFDRPGAATAVTTGSAITFEAAGTGVITFNDALVTTGSGNPTITKSGTGALNLNVANTFAGTGGFTISAGTVRISNGGALGGNTGGTTVVGNATAASRGSLELIGGISTNEAITLNNSGTALVNANGAIRNISGNNTITGQVTIDNGAGRINSDSGTLTLAGGLRADPDNDSTRTVTFGGAGSVIVSGVAANVSPTRILAITKDGTGTLTLSGANTHTGVTTVSGGTLIATSASALGTGNVVVATNTAFNYFAAADAALSIGGTLGITGGASTVIGGSIGSTPTSAQINVTGAATISNAAHRVNIYGVPGTTPTTGT